MNKQRGIIYILLLGDEVVYVGQTIAFELRMEKHVQNKVFDRVYIKYVDVEDLDREEKQAILKYKPSLNILLIDNVSMTFEERCEASKIRKDTDFSDFHTDVIDTWKKPKSRSTSFYIGYRIVQTNSTIGEIEKYMHLTFGNDPEGWAYLGWVMEQKAPIYRPHKYEAALKEMVKENTKNL